MEKRATSLISAFIKSGKISGKSFTVSQSNQDELEQALAAILSSASQLGTKYAQAMIEHNQRTSRGNPVGRFFQRAKEVVSGIIGRIRDVVAGIFSKDGTAQDAQDAVDGMLDYLPDTIATTEIHDEIEQAIADVFDEQEVEYVEWVDEPGSCEMCHANAEQGPIRRGEAFQSGHSKPTAHPCCRCNLVPSEG